MSNRTVTVLLLEDDDVDFECVRRAFRSAKLANPIVRARDGVEALEMLRGAQGTPKLAEPLLVLLDLNMPRMGGLEFLQEVRADPALRSLIVFVLTTSSEDRDRTAAYDKNVAGYLLKSEAGSGLLEATKLFDSFVRLIEFP